MSDDEPRGSPGDDRHGDDRHGGPDRRRSGGRSGRRPPGDPAGDDDTRDEPPRKYCVECGASINAKAEICPECGVRQPGTSSSEEPRIVAAVLAIVLGTFGAHKFYLGETGVGILYLCFSWTFIPTILGVVEGAIYLSKSDEQFREQYLEG